MAYVEIRKGGRLVTRRVVDDAKARKGCRIRMGSGGQVVVGLGESKKVGKYEFAVFKGVPSDDAYKVVEGLREISGSFPSMSQAVTADFPGAADLQSAESKSPIPVIEDYKIVDRLGEGGMGTVWRAVQLSTKREVAMKFLGRHRFASKKSRARFEREVSLAAKLTHPNIARVYHSGLHRNVYYYAMELIEGVHLDEFVQQNELSQQEVLELMRDICDAVRHAHEQGIIHRDLKPSNILVTKDGQPHIVDFGLAKASAEDEEDLSISIEGEVAGTLAYMAPEQAAGDLNKISERSDVYSLGAIMYELLTGRLPHDLSGSQYDIIKRIVEEDVQSPREFAHTIDSDLESLILAALAKEPEDRYPSAAVLLQDFENYLNGEALLARSLSRTYRIRKRIGKYRKRIVTTLGFVGVLFVFITAAFVLIQFEKKKSKELEQRLASLSDSQEQTIDGTLQVGKDLREQPPAGIVQHRPLASQDSTDDSLGGIAPAVRNPSKWVLYVDADATGVNDGYSWADAFVSLQDALAWAGGRVEIRVAKGTYKPDQGVDQTPGDQSATFKLKNGVSIRGGYAGVNATNPDARNIEQYITILSGDLNSDDVDVADVKDLTAEPTRAENSCHVVNAMEADATSVVDGLTIKGGNANGTGPGSTASTGGGILVYRGSPTLINCIFSRNSASAPENVSSGRGGGMSIGGGSPTLVNCTFSSNAAGFYGGGIINNSGSPTLTNCTFTKNWAEILGGGMNNAGNPTLTGCTFSENSVGEGGGGMYNQSSSPLLNKCTFTGNSAGIYGGGIQNAHDSKGTLINCIFTGNSARGGGAVYNSNNSSPEFENCVFSKNSCVEYGGGMYNFSDSNPTLVNCTFSGNIRGKGGGGGGIANGRNSSAALANCIMWGDRPEEIHLMDSTLVVAYSNVQYSHQGPWPGTGNLNTDPLFVDRNAGDYHLRPSSPCINAGDPNRTTEAGETDIDGESRIIGGRIDMGADEFGP